MDKNRLYNARERWSKDADFWRIADTETRQSLSRMALAFEAVMNSLEDLIDQLDDQLDEQKWDTRDRLAKLERRLTDRIAGRDEEEN